MADENNSLNVHIVTFNCGRAPVDARAFSKSFFQRAAGYPYVFPDIIVLALQEIAPIPFAFLGGSYLIPYYTEIVKAVNVASGKDAEYYLLATHNVGMTAIAALVKLELVPRVQDLRKAGVGCGMWNMGNKGAAGLRFSFALDAEHEQFTDFTFVAAHLAAMEDAVERRNKDWEAIVRGLVFYPTVEYGPKLSPHSSPEEGEEGETEPLLNSKDAGLHQSMFSPNSVLFFAGDLNYRTSDKGPLPEAHATYPAVDAKPGSDNDMKMWFKSDQLNREREAGRTTHLLGEAPVNFPPTYKYSLGRVQQSLKDKHPETPASLMDDDNEAEASEPEVWHWSLHRFPSWCDRVLFNSYFIKPPHTIHSSSDPKYSPLKVLAYTALPLQPTSDHRPVALSAKLDLTRATAAALYPGQDYEPPFPVDPGWKGKRSAARRSEIVVGILFYLGLTWEGNAALVALAAGGVGAYFVISAFLRG